MTAPTAEQPAAISRHPRSERARRAILTATADLLESLGYAAMTMDAVAIAAGASKATLYKHWSSKAALAMDAFLLEVDSSTAFPDSGSALDDVRKSVRGTVDLFNRPRVRQMLLGVLIELPHDADLRIAYRDRYITPRRLQGEIALLRGIDRGELEPGLDADVLFDEIYGAIYFRLLIGTAPLDHSFADAMVETAFKGVLASPRLRAGDSAEESLHIRPTAAVDSDTSIHEEQSATSEHVQRKGVS